MAVIDSGVDYTHPDLAQNYAGGWDFYSNDADPMDDCGHGTHVAGTVAAAMNDEGVVGVAPGVRLYAPRVLAKQSGNKCSGPLNAIIAAVEWAAQNGIQVTNNSYGSTSGQTVTTDQNGLGSLLLRNAPAGTYQTIVTWATSPGLDWDARTPPNSLVK